MHTGVVRDPVVGYQAGGAAGAGLGLVIGTTGLVLKPASGLLEFVSKAVNGLGMGILAWGDEVVRIPRTRIRSPRHFGMFAVDPTGTLHSVTSQSIQCLALPNTLKPSTLCACIPAVHTIGRACHNM